MAYAQINYSQKMGINPVYTIHEIGCLLTAFCNLESRFGDDIDPPTLNAFFVSNRDYLLSLEDGANVSDDLAWTTISSYDPSIVVTAVGSGAPTTNNAIVKFEYNSHQTGRPTTHFCLVSDYANGLIVDSWDGTIKSWNGYGGPKAWASYKKVIASGDNNVTLTAPDVQNLYTDILGRPADPGGLANYTGKSLDFTVQDMLGSEEYKSKVAAQYAAQISDLQNTVNTLSSELSAAQSAQPTTSATPEQVSGGRLVEALKEAING